MSLPPVFPVVAALVTASAKKRTQTMDAIPIIFWIIIVGVVAAVVVSLVWWFATEI